MKIGYARVSTQEQSLALQRNALRKAGCRQIYLEDRDADLAEGGSHGHS
jgi:DNA invertase Pin-like site-specific DNA recombinase